MQDEMLDMGRLSHHYWLLLVVEYLSLHTLCRVGPEDLGFKLCFSAPLVNRNLLNWVQMI